MLLKSGIYFRPMWMMDIFLLRMSPKQVLEAYSDLMGPPVSIGDTADAGRMASRWGGQQ